MKTILFTGILCCLIAAVDAQTLVTQAVKHRKEKHTTEAVAPSMLDQDARYLAAE